MRDRGYANPQLLWEAAELHARLNDPKLCLIDTRAGEEYSQRCGTIWRLGRSGGIGWSCRSKCQSLKAAQEP
jgi:hypothetical protein